MMNRQSTFSKTAPSSDNARRRRSDSAVLPAAVCVLISLAALAMSLPALAAAPKEPLPPAGIWALEFSPDGRWLAAGTNVRGHGGPIVIWRVEDWRPHAVRMEPSGGLDVAFSPDGKLLAYSTRSPEVGLIEVSSGTLTRRIKVLDTDKGSVFSVTFSPDGESLLTSGTDRMIREWNVADGSLTRTFEGHSDTVRGIAVSPDGSLLLSGGRESRLWDRRTGEVLQVFKPMESIVRRVRFSHDGRFFLTSKWDGKTRIRETETRQLRAVLSPASNSAGLTRDNQLAATATHYPSASVYRLQLSPPDHEQARRLRGLIRQLDDEDYAVREAASEEIAEIGMVAEPLLREALDAASPEVRIRARRLRQRVMSPEPIATLSGHRGDVEVVCFSPDDTLLATGCRGGDVKVWSVPEFKEVVTLTAPRAE